MKSPDVKYDWQAKSLCKKQMKYDPKTKSFTHFTVSDFYPGSGKTVTQEVRKMCNRCPVQKECLEHGLRHERYGQWGGISEVQRVKVREQEGIEFVALQPNVLMDQN